MARMEELQSLSYPWFLTKLRLTSCFLLAFLLLYSWHLFKHVSPAQIWAISNIPFPDGKLQSFIQDFVDQGNDTGFREIVYGSTTLALSFNLSDSHRNFYTLNFTFKACSVRSPYVLEAESDNLTQASSRFKVAIAVDGNYSVIMDQWFRGLRLILYQGLSTAVVSLPGSSTQTIRIWDWCCLIPAVVFNRLT